MKRDKREFDISYPLVHPHQLVYSSPDWIGVKLQSMQQRVLLVVLAFALALSAASASRVLSAEDGEQLLFMHLWQPSSANSNYLRIAGGSRTASSAVEPCSPSSAVKFQCKCYEGFAAHALGTFITVQTLANTLKAVRSFLTPSHPLSLPRSLSCRLLTRAHAAANSKRQVSRWMRNRLLSAGRNHGWPALHQV